MSDSNPRPSLSSLERWSSRLADRYQIRLTDCLIDWFDSEQFLNRGLGEFSAPIHPAELLADAPEPIWPALMSCDMIPMIGNDAGDYLCARVGSNSTITEFVHWYHGGGDWIPWGKRLPEAIIFDAVNTHLPGPHHRHAVPAEERCSPDLNDRKKDPLVQWALSRLPIEIKIAIEQNKDQNKTADVLAEKLLEHDIATAAVRFELVEHALFPESGQPDFAKAESIVLRTIGGRCSELESLSWTWNVAAIAAHNRGDFGLAIDRFGQALLGSNFSDQSVRLRHDWQQTENAKYASSQLIELSTDHSLPHFDDHQRSLLRLYSSPAIDDRGQAVTDYWTNRSSAMEEQGDFAAAHDCLVRAGWDLGAAPMRAYEGLLQNIARLAAAAGQSGRAAVAATHLACFNDRYGRS
ncbi:hypothetical protein LF1_50310 [Rubripirellula obstinata]|uniref:Uncharacterized protein n=1 Tax=Rubripirellula obstinata TaxID=406547 RepID=A0A5B1CMQ1_9BACT|nr:hypothetical protein [Rubripirellula obstinata]KAA1262467.1 hypothetical protein LF1_50310 [Rubripirellula obstinata]